MNKLITLTIIKNEEKKFLKEWLENIVTFSDHCVIVDDASTDNTPKIIKEFMEEKKHPYTLKILEKSLFTENEVELRTILWEETRKIANEGDFCFVLDADEIVCPEIHNMKQALINLNIDGVVGFKKIEMWDDKNYRIDKLWSNYFGRGFKYKNENFGFKGGGLHLPCVPAYAFYGQNSWNSGVRVKHLAYSTEELRKEKYSFAIKNCNPNDSINYNQLQSIIDKEPVLKEYKDKLAVPSVNLILSLHKHYNIKKILEDLKLIAYDENKLKFSFACYKCHPQVFDQINSFPYNEKIPVNVNIQNFKYDFHDNPVQHVLAETIESCKKDDSEYQFIILPEAEFNASTILEQIQTDRDLVFYISQQKPVGLFIQTKLLRVIPTELLVTGNNFDFNKIFERYKEFVWYTGLGVPAPFYKV